MTAVTEQKKPDFYRSATIGPESWRNLTLRNIRLAQTVSRKSDGSVARGRSVDPLPNLRDVNAECTNNEIHKYSRDAREVLAKLRATIIELNTEIKSLIKIKEELDKWHQSIRKDIQLNKDCVKLRTRRPTAEKEHDGADDLISAERTHLGNLKKNLESQLCLITNHLQVMDKVRENLFAVQAERSRVLDLVCHTIDVNREEPTPLKTFDFTFNTSAVLRAGDAIKTRQPVVADAQATFTVDAENAISDCKEVRERSVHLRNQSRSLLAQTRKLQNAAHNSVNFGVNQKVEETKNLRGHLLMGVAENKHSLHKAQRWFDTSEIARLNTLGPESTNDMTTSERIDRPLVRVFQRHPGNQVPEGRNIIECGNELLRSMTDTGRNIGLLNLTQARLENDFRSKTLGSQVDADVIRLRRRRKDHRWAMGSAF